MMEHEDLTKKIIGCAYRVYYKMGFGFLESERPIYHGWNLPPATFLSC